MPKRRAKAKAKAKVKEEEEEEQPRAKAKATRAVAEGPLPERKTRGRPPKVVPLHELEPAGKPRQGREPARGREPSPSATTQQPPSARAQTPRALAAKPLREEGAGAPVLDPYSALLSAVAMRQQAERERKLERYKGFVAGM